MSPVLTGLTNVLNVLIKPEVLPTVLVPMENMIKKVNNVMFVKIDVLYVIKNPIVTLVKTLKEEEDLLLNVYVLKLPSLLMMIEEMTVFLALINVLYATKTILIVIAVKTLLELPLLVNVEIENGIIKENLVNLVYPFVPPVPMEKNVTPV